MYAIVSLNGHQHRIEPGQVVVIDRHAGEIGSTFALSDSVLLLDTGEDVHVGTPTVPEAEVEFEVLEHFRGRKLVVFKMKRRKRYRRKHGHRQDLTRVMVRAVRLGKTLLGVVPESPAENAEPEPVPATEPPAESPT
ncbi:MAG: 50S ribosomal protein L21 [Kiritimatiellaeota bacterium]|nr:50S ribosomal protein L21 [Kiritimatiellota bacterium]